MQHAKLSKKIQIIFFRISNERNRQPNNLAGEKLFSLPVYCKRTDFKQTEKFKLGGGIGRQTHRPNNTKHHCVSFLPTCCCSLDFVFIRSGEVISLGLGLPPIQANARLRKKLMILFFRPLRCPAEAFIFNIPAGFSLQLNSALLIPMGATPSHSQKV